MYNNNLYDIAYGTRIGATLQFPYKMFTDITLDIQRTHYKDKKINDILSGFDWTFYVHPKYYLNNHSFISFTTAISHNETAISALGSDTGRIAIGYFYKIPYGFNFYINLNAQHIIENNDNNNNNGGKRNKINGTTLIQQSAKEP